MPGSAAHLVDLVQQVGRGDSSAFANLYDETSPSVYGMALSMVRSPQLATVLTTEVYTEAWQRAARYDPSEGNVLSWLMSLAHRHFVERVHTMSQESVPERYAALNVDREFDRVGDDGGRRQDAEPADKALLAQPDLPGRRDAGLLRGLQPDRGGPHPRAAGGHGDDEHPGRAGRPRVRRVRSHERHARRRGLVCGRRVGPGGASRVRVASRRLPRLPVRGERVRGIVGRAGSPGGGGSAGRPARLGPGCGGRSSTGGSAAGPAVGRSSQSGGRRRR